MPISIIDNYPNRMEESMEGFSKIQKTLAIIAFYIMALAMVGMAIAAFKDGGSIFPRLERLEERDKKRTRLEEHYLGHRHGGIYGEAIFQEDSTEN